MVHWRVCCELGAWWRCITFLSPLVFIHERTGRREGGRSTSRFLSKKGWLCTDKQPYTGPGRFVGLRIGKKNEHALEHSLQGPAGRMDIPLSPLDLYKPKHKSSISSLPSSKSLASSLALNQSCPNPRRTPKLRPPKPISLLKSKRLRSMSSTSRKNGTIPFRL